jgi:tetratricopeptide (TPR) repeat protein
MAKELEKIRWRFREAKRLDLFEELVIRHTQANPVLAHWRGIQLGKIYLQQGRWLDAEAQFAKALEANEDAEAHAGLSEAYFNLKKWDAAELHAAKALLRDTKNPWYHFLLARALLSQQKYEAALSAVDGAISLTRGWKDYYFDLRGLIHTGQKRYLEALKDWQLALAIKPSNTGYMIQLGNTYDRLGMKAKARQYFQMAKKKEQAAPSSRKDK